MFEIFKSNPYVVPAILVIADLISIPLITIGICRKHQKGQRIKRIVAVIAVIVIIDGGYAVSQLGKNSYYDIKGIKHSDPTQIVYYDKDGNKYTYENGNYGELFKNENGTHAFTAENAYIDKDGYLVIITEKLEEDVNTNTFKDKDGNQYYHATDVSWNKSGKMKINK